jgi:hypothetical protein
MAGVDPNHSRLRAHRTAGVDPMKGIEISRLIAGVDQNCMCASKFQVLVTLKGIKISRLRAHRTAGVDPMKDIPVGRSSPVSGCRPTAVPRSRDGGDPGAWVDGAGLLRQRRQWGRSWRQWGVQWRRGSGAARQVVVFSRRPAWGDHGTTSRAGG